jgi:hypothetical protein
MLAISVVIYLAAYRSRLPIERVRELIEESTSEQAKARSS